MPRSPTILQERLADKIIENAKTKKHRTKKALLMEVGYSRQISKVRPTEILNAEGTRLALKARGFTEENAKGTIASILTSKRSKDENKLRAASEIFKVMGSYAPDKHINVTANIKDLLDTMES